MLASNTVAQNAAPVRKCAGILRGVVLDPGGQPLKETVVEAWPLGIDLGMMLPHTKTNQEGEYRFEEICPGRYSVLPADKKAGYPDSSPYLYDFLYGKPAAEVELTD